MPIVVQTEVQSLLNIPGQTLASRQRSAELFVRQCDTEHVMVTWTLGELHRQRPPTTSNIQYF